MVSTFIPIKAGAPPGRPWGLLGSIWRSLGSLWCSLGLLLEVLGVSGAISGGLWEGLWGSLGLYLEVPGLPGPPEARGSNRGADTIVKTMLFRKSSFFFAILLGVFEGRCSKSL